MAKINQKTAGSFALLTAQAIGCIHIENLQIIINGVESEESYFIIISVRCRIVR